MGFTYLDLYSGDDGKVTADISCKSTVRSVGTETSRWSKGPFATFALDGFTGLSVIDTNSLVKELLTRMTVQQLMGSLAYEFSSDELFEMLRKRTK